MTNRSLAEIEEVLARRGGVPYPRLEGWKWAFPWAAASIAGAASAKEALLVLGPVAGLSATLVASAMAFLGTRIVLGRDHRPWELLRVVDGIDAKRVWSVIQEASGRIERISVAGRLIQDAEAHARAAKLVAIATGIVRGFEEDPADIRRSRHFLNTYLGDAAMLVERFAQLEGKGGARVAEVTVKVRETLHDLERAFERQKEINVSDDAEALDVEIAVTKRLLEETKD